MKHYFDEYGNELPARPNLWKGRSPVSDALFVELGGSITEDEEPTPQQRVCGEFRMLIADLASKTDKITPEEFLGVAQKGISSDLVSFARARGVPEDVITEGRARIVEVMADALRFGMAWEELVNGTTNA